jgi:hypothetical protein
MRAIRSITVARNPGHQHSQSRAGKKQNRAVSLYWQISSIPLSHLQQNNRRPYRISISVSPL